MACQCRAVASSGAAKIGWPQRGFPTPNASDEPMVCRSLSIPSQADWLGIVAGCLDYLTEPANWFLNGDMTQEESAQAFVDILAGMFDLEGSCGVQVPTPYWDEAAEVDDEAFADDQVWYGEVDDPTVVPTELTFRENAEIWTFAGLLAIAGVPGAALSFLTFAPKFVLAFKQGDVGKIIRVFIDADEAATITDSGDGSVVEVPIVTEESMDGHHIWITVGEA